MNDLTLLLLGALAGFAFGYQLATIRAEARAAMRPATPAPAPLPDVAPRPLPDAALTTAARDVPRETATLRGVQRGWVLIIPASEHHDSRD